LLLRGQFFAQGFDLRAQGRQSALLGRAFQAECLGIQLDQNLALLHLRSSTKALRRRRAATGESTS